MNGSVTVSQMMIETTRSALAPRNNDDNTSFKETKEDDMELMRISSDMAFDGKEVGIVADQVRRGPKLIESSTKGKRTTPPRPGSHRSAEVSDQVIQPLSKQQSQQQSFDSPSAPRPPLDRAAVPTSHRASGVSPSKLTRFPDDASSSPRLHTIDGSTLKVPTKDSASTLPSIPSMTSRPDPAEQEQALFEQRLCEDAYGVAVRKINQYGKSNLRYVKCISVDDSDLGGKSTRSTSSRSVGSRGRRPSLGKQRNSENSKRALSWGKKKDVQIPLERFTSVRKGKTTERARRNPSPATRVLSLVTNDPNHPSLDIEAPTRVDRDKFARAFSKFLRVPLECDDSHSVHSDLSANTGRNTSTNGERQWSASMSAPGEVSTKNPPLMAEQVKAPLSAPAGTDERKEAVSSANLVKLPTLPLEVRRESKESKAAAETLPTNSNTCSSANQESSKAAVIEIISSSKHSESEEGDDISAVSSLTRNGYDQEIVEELHNALNELRTELEESRAEASRAVKVAEQAIQSAEKSSSAEWQNTVTHKAAEAAAMAQKRSAEALARARLAEERLEGERRTAAFWRRQAEAAEEEAGALQTRAAAAEVQRAALEGQLQSERRKVSAHVEGLKRHFASSEKHQREALEAALERNRVLDLELDGTRRDLQLKANCQDDVESTGEISKRKKLSLVGRQNWTSGSDGTDSAMLVAADTVSSSSAADQGELRDACSGDQGEGTPVEQIMKLHAEASVIRKQFEMLRRTTQDDLRSLPNDAVLWGDQVTHVLQSTQAEVELLRKRLAVESASRRKLLHEVQDLRGVVRVYCRPLPSEGSVSTEVMSMPSQETLVLHRERFSKRKEMLGPLCFDFDRIFDPKATQLDVYGEMEDICLGVLDGYNICIMAHGQTGSGKTHTMLGDVKVKASHDKCGRVKIESLGLQLQAMKQLFTVAENRSDRYKDTFSLTIVEVYNERLCDLLAGTEAGDSRGKVVTAESKSASRKNHKPQDDDASSGKQTKLEIRTDVHGDTVVQGLISVDVESFQDARRIWEDCLTSREKRLAEQGSDSTQYAASSHVIASLKVVSANIATGLGSVGRIQFVDLAGSDLVRRRPSASKPADNLVTSIGDNSEWRFANRSLETLDEVVSARLQFERSVPYRNSTLTHLLRDSLEADTKVIFLACVSSDPKDLQETAATLRFAARMRRVSIGRATKHNLSPP